jgi:hypothetical protein
MLILGEALGEALPEGEEEGAVGVVGDAVTVGPEEGNTLGLAEVEGALEGPFDGNAL